MEKYLANCFKKWYNMALEIKYKWRTNEVAIMAQAVLSFIDLNGNEETGKSWGMPGS